MSDIDDKIDLVATCIGHGIVRFDDENEIPHPFLTDSGKIGVELGDGSEIVDNSYKTFSDAFDEMIKFNSLDDDSDNQLDIADKIFEMEKWRSLLADAGGKVQTRLDSLRRRKNAG